MPITDFNYHAFCSYINIGVCSPVHGANREHSWSEHGRLDMCVCMRVSVVEDDDEFINSYSLCTHHCLLLHSLTVWQQCDACRIILWLHFLLLFINFWSMHECVYRVSVACHFGHWLYSRIHLHSTQQYVYQFEKYFASCSFLSPFISRK